MKSKVFKVFVIIAAAVFGIEIIYQVYLKLSFPYETTVAQSYSLSNIINAKGIIFKDEKVIKPSAQGNVNYLFENGAKVAKGAQVAQIYQNKNDVLATEQINKIDQKIARLNDVQAELKSQSIDADTVQKGIYLTYQNILNALNKGDFTTIADSKEELIYLFNEKQIVTGQSDNIEDAKSKLQAQKAELQKSISSVPQYISSDVSGYFVDSVDGYEDKYTLESAKNITKDALKQEINAQSTAGGSDSSDSSDTSDSSGQTVSSDSSESSSSSSVSNAENGICKVIENPVLKFETIVDSKSMANVKLNKSYKLTFKGSENETDAVLTRLDINNNEDDGVAEFEITDISQDTAPMRFVDCDITIDSNEGLKVPKTAIRENDNGEAGVYVANNISMKFKKIDIVFENEDSVLSAVHSSDSGYLANFDNIIVQGADLYDGKYLR